MKSAFLATAIVAVVVSTASAGPVVITEWMYSPGTGTNASPGEYFEITNVSGSPVNMTGWTQDDSTSDIAGGPGAHPLDDFGTLAPGESAVGVEGDNTVAAFRSYWGLSASVKVIAYGTSNNFARSDTINIYDNTNTRVDQLVYNDATLGGPRTQGIGGNIPFAQLGLNHPNLAVASVVGDIYGSHRGGLGSATQSDLGSPGSYAVPEPASIVLAFVGALAVFGARRRS